MFFSYLFLSLRTMFWQVAGRMVAKVQLRMNWLFMSTTGKCVRIGREFAIFPTIDPEDEVDCYRDMLKLMKAYRLTFREIGVDPISFWENLKAAGLRLRQIIIKTLTCNYVGTRLANYLIGLVNEAYAFIKAQAPKIAVPVPTEAA